MGKFSELDQALNENYCLKDECIILQSKCEQLETQLRTTKAAAKMNVTILNNTISRLLDENKEQLDLLLTCSKSIMETTIELAAAHQRIDELERKINNGNM